jgi:hypothetical protein
MAKILDLEHQEQVKLFCWASLNTPNIPQLDLLYAIPNGGKRSISVAKKLKDEGQKAGILDVVLPYPSDGYGALYIEIKTRTGALRREQRIWIKKLQEAGNKVVIARSFEQARDAILLYLFINLNTEDNLNQ